MLYRIIIAGSRDFTDYEKLCSACDAIITGLTANDAQSEMIWIDRDGNRFKSHDKYGICLAPTSFDLGVTDEYTLFCQIVSGSPDYSPWSDTKIFRNIY